MTSSRKPIRAKLAIATVASLALVANTSLVSAQADPVYPSAGEVKLAKAAVGSKAAQVTVIEGRLKASDARLADVQKAAAVATEQYNLARLLLQDRTDAASSAEARATAAQTKADIANDKLGQFAATAYMQGGNLGQLEAFLSSKGPQEVLDRAAGIQLITDIRSRIMQDARASSVVAGVLHRQAAHAKAQRLAAEQVAQSARARAQSQADAVAAETAKIAKQQSELIAQLAALRSTSVTLERQRQAGLIAEAERRAAAARKARAQAEARAAAQARADARALAARNAAQNVPTPGPRSDPPLPSGGGGVAAVIAFARAQIGEPYLWGGEGPDRWDCSGLTMKAWAQAGVNLRHYTGWQWADTARIPVTELQPGDLVFYGDSGPSSHHMGLYIGDDTMIEAPRAGVPVRYGNIWRSDLLPYGGRP